MLQEKSRTLRIDEIPLEEKSVWLGSSISDLNLGERYNLLALALKSTTEAGEQLTFNPPADTKLSSKAVLIVMGDADNVSRARAEANPE